MAEHRERRREKRYHCTERPRYEERWPGGDDPSFATSQRGTSRRHRRSSRLEPESISRRQRSAARSPIERVTRVYIVNTGRDARSHPDRQRERRYRHHSEEEESDGGARLSHEHSDEHRHHTRRRTNTRTDTVVLEEEERRQPRGRARPAAPPVATQVPPIATQDARRPPLRSSAYDPRGDYETLRRQYAELKLSDEKRRSVREQEASSHSSGSWSQQYQVQTNKATGPEFLTQAAYTGGWRSRAEDKAGYFEPQEASASPNVDTDPSSRWEAPAAPREEMFSPVDSMESGTTQVEDECRNPAPEKTSQSAPGPSREADRARRLDTLLALKEASTRWRPHQPPLDRGPRSLPALVYTENGKFVIRSHAGTISHPTKTVDERLLKLAADPEMPWGIVEIVTDNARSYILRAYVSSERRIHNIEYSMSPGFFEDGWQEYVKHECSVQVFPTVELIDDENVLISCDLALDTHVEFESTAKDILAAMKRGDTRWKVIFDPAARLANLNLRSSGKTGIFEFSWFQALITEYGYTKWSKSSRSTS